MPFFTYVIYSLNHKRYYKGHCEDLENRLKEHNRGKTKSIKAFLPWELVYYEEFPTREEAIKREKYFKSAAGRIFLQKKLKKE
jgi:putative endonuclease